MRLSLEWSIARRYLSSRRRDGFISLTAMLSVISIALGVAALITVMSVMNGFRAELISQILGYQGHVLMQSYSGKFLDFDTLTKDLAAIPGVESVTPFSENQVMITHGQQARGGLVRGYPDTHFTAGQLNIKRVLAGDMALAADYGGVVLGAELARKLGVFVGDEVTIVSPKPLNSALGSQLRYLAFPVAAIVEIGVYQYDEAFVGMPLQEAQTFFRLGDSVPLIEMRVSDPDTLSPQLLAAQSVLGDRGLARSWQDFNQVFVNALQTERVAMFFILSLIIVVAVFNIASSLFMLVKEKSADIAILKTMGLSSGSVMRVFVAVGLSVGLFGVVSGGLLAWLLIANIQAIKTGIEALFGLNVWDPSVRIITELTAKVDPTEVIITVALAVMLSFMAAIIPARRAAKIDPVDVLRYE